MSHSFKRAGLLFLIFCVCLGLLWGFLAMTALIPDEAIHDNMLKSALSYKEKEAFAFPESGRYCGISDNYSDAILLGVAFNMGESGALDTKYYSGGEYGVNAGLYMSLTDETVSPDTDYSRYWHGNAGIARVKHLYLDVEGIKLTEFLKILVLGVFCAALLLRKKCPRTCVCFVLALISVHIWNVRLALEYQPLFIVAFFMCILFILLERRGSFALGILSVIGGVLTAFFDFLTCETLPLLLPLGLVFAVRIEQGRGEKLSSNLKLFLFAGICFVLSYLGTFLAKWLLASLATGENKFALAMTSAGVRLGAEESAGFLSGIPANLTVLFGGRERIEATRVISGVLISAAVLSSAFYLFKKKDYDRDGIITLLFVGAAVFLRYGILQNHSYLHEFFTYRALGATVFSVLAAVMLSSCGKRKKKH